ATSKYAEAKHYTTLIPNICNLFVTSAFESEVTAGVLPLLPPIASSLFLSGRHKLKGSTVSLQLLASPCAYGMLAASYNYKSTKHVPILKENTSKDQLNISYNNSYVKTDV
ncbi:hypothetical protein C0J52_27038, partial [Blattella germanica]